MKKLLVYFLPLLISCTDNRAPDAHKPVSTGPAGKGNNPSEAAKASLPTDSGLVENGDFITYVARPEHIRMYWKHNDTILQNFSNLKKREPQIQFAMNGGMFTKAYGPVGLYVENGRKLKDIKRYNNGKVNFGLQPQGIFLLRGRSADVVPLDDYSPSGVTYATQSAPMLVLDSRINPELPHSNSANIRNGVGMLPDGRVLMTVSQKLVTFQQFAQYFVDKGCRSALYLDGSISEAYLPGVASYGYFGVMVGVVKRAKSHK